MQVALPSLTRGLSREQACVRLLLSCGHDGRASEEREYEVRWQDLASDAAAMGLLRIMNVLWARAGIRVCGCLVVACTYAIEPLGLGASLVEIVPRSVTLGDLKRTYTKGDVVADHLGYDPWKLARLAASTAAFLASSYLLGVATGDCDNVMLTADGALFGADFDHMFGHSCIGMPCPVVWLPKAVTFALGCLWPEVQEAAVCAFRAARVMFSPTPPPQRETFALWFQVQAALLKVACLLSLPVEHYSLGLTEEDFRAAMEAADSTLGKKLSTLLHDTFGFNSRRKLPSSIESGRWSAPLINRFPHAFEAVAADIDSVVWAVEADAKNWCLALCILACLCRDQEASVCMLESLVWDHLLVAVSSDSALLRLGVLEVIAAMAKHHGGEVQAWLARAAGSGPHAESLRAMVRSFHEHTVNFQTSTCIAGSESSADHVALKLGALCVVARMDPPGDSRQAPQAAAYSDLAPAAAHEGQVVRRSAARVIVAMMKSEDPTIQKLLEEVAVHMTGSDLAAATRDLAEDERFGVIRTVEGFAKDAGVGERLCSWARACLTAMAEDGDPEVSRAAVCAIACAVHDEDPGVRSPRPRERWARGFLTAAAWDQANPRPCAPVYALVRMAQVGEPRVKYLESYLDPFCTHLSLGAELEGDLQYLAATGTKASTCAATMMVWEREGGAAMPVKEEFTAKIAVD